MAEGTGGPGKAITSSQSSSGQEEKWRASRGDRGTDAAQPSDSLAGGLVGDRPPGLFDRAKPSDESRPPEASGGVQGEGGGVADKGGKRPTFSEVFDILAPTMYTRWYDIFLHLGFDQKELDKHLNVLPPRERYTLFTLVQDWVDREDPPPSWEALVHVLRNKLLEGKLAADIEEKFLGIPRMDSDDDEEYNEKEDTFSAHFDKDTIEFSKLMIGIYEGLGSLSYPELYHFISSVRCPDGSQLVNPDTFQERRTPEGVMLCLVYTSMCSALDVDFLIYLLQSLHRDDLLDMVREYVEQVSVYRPETREVYNTSKHFLLKIVLNPAIKHIDIGMVSALKHAVCVRMGIEDRPYLIQYMGWRDKPITAYFQVPVACMFLVQDCIADVECTRDFASNGIVRIALEINECRFEFDMVNPGDTASRLFKGNPVERTS